MLTHFMHWSILIPLESIRKFTIFLGGIKMGAWSSGLCSAIILYLIESENRK